MPITRYELFKTDHGIDGHDAKTTLVARFTTRVKAKDYITKLGHTVEQWGKGQFYHKDPDKRFTMGAISFEIREEVRVPVDPK